MKPLTCLIYGLCIAVFSFAQPACLEIATDKTTSLVFPFAIRHVDMGSRNVLVQQVPQAENVLLVKAANKDFEETNLSVVTSDGSVYSFAVNYSPAPPVWVHKLPALTGFALESYAKGILDNQRTLHGIHKGKWNVTAFVKGIYIKGDILFFQLEVDNKSAINYDIDLLRFSIRDQVRAKRTASQELELKPLLIVGNDSKVLAYQSNIVVVALPKFTIPDDQYLSVELMEKAGGRHLAMKVSNKKIVKAILLPDYK